MSPSLRCVINLVLLLFCTGCIGSCTRGPQPDLGKLYNYPAQRVDVERNPVIVIPGILGSVLTDVPSKTTVWGSYRGHYADPGKPEGARLLALPMRDGVKLSELKDEVTNTGALETLQLRVLGIPYEGSAYFDILRTLGAGGFRDKGLADAGAIDYGDDHFTCFQFSYDWRRSNVENAARLKKYIIEQKAYVEKELEKRHGMKKSVKFDIVAHSMGGLVTRYFLMYGDQPMPADGSLPQLTWDGAQYVERAIIVGTPNAGSAKAFDQLLNGYQVASVTPFTPNAILCTMPSIYELMPRVRHGAFVDASTVGRTTPEVVDVYDADLWDRMGWGLLNPSQEKLLAWLMPGMDTAEARRAVALDHTRKCLDNAHRFHAALDLPVRLPTGLSMYLFAGDAEQTLGSFAIDLGTGKVLPHHSDHGDGTVLRTSALLDERAGDAEAIRTMTVNSPIPWTHVTFLFRDHIGLTRDPTFQDNLLYLLLEAPHGRTPRPLQ